MDQVPSENAGLILLLYGQATVLHTALNENVARKRTMKRGGREEYIVGKTCRDGDAGGEERRRSCAY